MKKTLILIFLLFSYFQAGAEIRVGVARKVITPQTPFWLTGFASRDKPSTEVLHDLWAKAVVFEEKPGSYVVIVTTDLLGLSHEISEEIAGKVSKKYGINRSQLLLSSSHTHSGPVIWPCLSIIFNLTPAEMQIVAEYNHKLTDDILNVIDLAIGNLEPAQIWSGHGSADFAVNRRQRTEKEVIIGVNPDGPVDHDVPVIKITTPDGALKAILFSYACHNTTSNTYLINGDYAGFAQIELEKANPGVTAMFLAGCGADQNPDPRGTLEIAGQYGKALAETVQKVIKGELRPVRLPIRTYYNIVNLDFRPFDPEIYQKELASQDKFEQRRAMLILEAYNKGWDVSHYPYPVQAIRFNKDLTILAMSGEPVVDYPIRVKSEYGRENLFMAGYCNEVQCYIPSKRILAEGGYEAESSMIYYGYPGPFANTVEDKIFSAIHKVMKNTGARISKK